MTTEIKANLTREDYASFNTHLFIKKNLKKYIALSIGISLALPFFLPVNLLQNFLILFSASLFTTFSFGY
ncbi:MAG: hypothetical protein IPN13_12245 [Bacteroidetes bacterium]|nr:hypothetical protein [Bacteroidota bacterium]